MKAKEYLDQYRKLTTRIRILEREIEMVQEESAKMDGQPRGSDISDNTSRLALKLAEMGDELAGMKRDALIKREEIRKTIEEVQNDAYSELLYLRYIELLTWDGVADQMVYSWRHVLRMHDKAIQEVEKKLKKS